MHFIEGDEPRAIRRYLGLRKDSLPWLFLSERQGRLTRFAINYLVDRTASAAVSLTFIRIVTPLVRLHFAIKRDRRTIRMARASID
jgi:hypothetical protein